MPVVVEYTFNAPVERVWNALTDKDQIRKWSFDVSDFKPEAGFEFHFYGGSEERRYLHECRVTEVVPAHKLAHTWSYREYPHETIVTIELFANGSQTGIKLTHEGIEKIPAGDNKDFDPASFAQGWNHIIGKSLKTFLEA